MSELIKTYKEIYNYLIKHRETNPEFTFATRVNNRENKITNGYYFQGNDHYIFVPLYKVGDNDNKTKTIGFVYEEDQQSIEIVFGAIQEKEENELKIYEEIIKYLKTYNNKHKLFKKTKIDKNNTRHAFYFGNKKLNENLNFYIGEFKNFCDDIIKKNGLNEKYIVTETEFLKNLGKFDILPSTSNETKKSSENIQPLNQILYGPPGTGKTYNTINKALEIIFEAETDKTKEIKFTHQDHKLNMSINDLEEILKKDNLDSNERKNLKTAFEFYKVEQGQIEFVTFHQSYGYEEFVEGIKAQTTTDDTTKQQTITYDIEAGIFKRICEKAKMIKSEKISVYDFDEKINIWKISLGDSQNSEDEYLFDYCVENNKILLGFGDGIDFKECKNREEIAIKLNDSEKYSYPPTAVNTFKNKMKSGDIVLISYGNRKLRAIAKITSEYKHLVDDNLKTYVQSRDVEWLLVPDEPFSYEKVLKKQFSQMTIYDIKSNVKIEELKKLLTQANETTAENNKNYILIIDEINRGNISKIFGELITLIEPSKRIGAEEAITLKLPYSGDAFGVPQNLYIIGTMNTADRSIALMDTALRRRFDFTEMMPDLETLNEFEYIEGINIKSLLETINKRIEYLYDRDHTIGHAYFISLKDKNGDEVKAELDNIFRNKIIPLLQEYFYDDWEKIQIVLGDHPEQFKKKEISKNFNQYQFIQSEKIKEEEVLGLDHPDIENNGVEYKINSIFKHEAYLKIYGEYPKLKTDENEEQTNTFN